MGYNQILTLSLQNGFGYKGRVGIIIGAVWLYHGPGFGLKRNPYPIPNNNPIKGSVLGLVCITNINISHLVFRVQMVVGVKQTTTV